MKALSTFFILGVFALSTSARAATVTDLDDWAQSFTQAALKSDPDGMTDLVHRVSESNFDTTQLKDGMQRMEDFLGPDMASYAEQFEGARLGTFARRINIAVVYPKHQLYYSVFFLRRPDGWTMTNLSFNKNLSEILKIGWPG